MVLQNDVKPAQYEGEIARLNAQLASLQRQHDEQQVQLNFLHLQQRMFCGGQTLLEYVTNNRNRYSRLENVLQRASSVLTSADIRLQRLWATPAFTTEVSQAHSAIHNTVRILERSDNNNDASDDEEDPTFDAALRSARNIADSGGLAAFLEGAARISD